MARDRARIAAWLVSKPVSVTMPATLMSPKLTACEGRNSPSNDAMGPFPRRIRCSPIPPTVTGYGRLRHARPPDGDAGTRPRSAQRLLFILERQIEGQGSCQPVLDDLIFHFLGERFVGQDKLMRTENIRCAPPT